MANPREGNGPSRAFVALVRALGLVEVLGLEAAVNEFDDRMAAVARAQLDLLDLVHRSVLDVVAARKQLEKRIGELEQGGRRVAEQHGAAVAAGEEQAELLANQSARVEERIGELREDLAGLRGAEDLLTARAALMQEQIADFRNTMALISAKVVAARTSAVTGEALDTLRDALTYVEFVVR
jgi:phage shock protein A